MKRTVDRRLHVLGRRLQQRPADDRSLHAQASRLVTRDDRATGALELDAGIRRGRAEERIPATRLVQPSSDRRATPKAKSEASSAEFDQTLSPGMTTR